MTEQWIEAECPECGCSRDENLRVGKRYRCPWCDAAFVAGDVIREEIGGES
jgi:hypothetical protein